jgi:hypothetical protein
MRSLAVRHEEIEMPFAELIVQACLYLFSLIAVSGGALQMALGQPDTVPRLDNVHRFMAGIYLGTGLICFWAARTAATQNTLIYLLALGVFLAGVGRLISISRVGLPKPPALWLAYLVPELTLPLLMTAAQMALH